MRALPRVARAVSSNPDAYVYLAESIRAWPDQPALAARIARRRLALGGLAQPHRRHRRPAHGDQARLTSTSLGAMLTFNVRESRTWPANSGA